MDAREVDSNAVPFSGPLPRSNLNQKLALRLALRMGALQYQRQRQKESEYAYRGIVHAGIMAPASLAVEKGILAQNPR